MQVGPLAQVLIGYAQGHPLTRKYTDLAIEKIAAIGGVRATPAALHSTLGRHAARAIRACMLAELAQKHLQLLTDNISKGDYTVHNQPVMPTHEVEGVGTHEAPRGTLSHWIVIKDEKIKNYQAVVPSTWNASPRDKAGAHGPYEASLLHTPLARGTSGGFADSAFVRSVHGVRLPCVRSIRQEDRSSEDPVRQALIGGIGNVLLGDDGVGPCVVRLLESRYDFDESVAIADLGTPALDLTHQIVGLRCLILVDSVTSDEPAGTLALYRKEDILRDTPGQRLDPHSPALSECLMTAEMLGAMPEHVLLVGIAGECYEPGNPLSMAVRQSVEPALDAILQELQRLGFSFRKKVSPDEPGIWWCEDDDSFALETPR
jgi:hydrogenase maturation protease